MDLQQQVEALVREHRQMAERLGEVEQDRQRVTQMEQELRQLKERRTLSRPTPSFLILAAVVLALTATCARRAWASVTTPNAMVVNLTTQPGGFSSPVTIPVSNQVVMVSGTTPTVPGTGFVHLTYTTTIDGPMITWSGIHAADGATTSPGIASGFTQAVGTQLVDVAFGGTAELQPGPTVNQLRVRNSTENDFTPKALDHRLTLIW